MANNPYQPPQPPQVPPTQSWGEVPQTPPAPQKKKATTGDIVRRIIFVVALLVFLVSAGYLAKTLWERWDARQEATQLQEIAGVPLDASGVVKAYEPLTREALDKLKAINPDFVAWIAVPGTNINYPIVQGTDNDQYLHNTFEGKSRTAGTLFLDYLNNPEFTDFNSIVYGHHMRDKTMFQNLTLLREKDEFDRVRTIYVQLYDGDVLKYEIVSAYVCHADYDYRTIEYGEQQDAQDFLNRILEKSAQKLDGVELTPEDRILTLSTCEYDYSDGRFAVHGKLLSQTPLEKWGEE